MGEAAEDVDEQELLKKAKRGNKGKDDTKERVELQREEAEHCVGGNEGVRLTLEELVIDEKTVRNDKKKKKKKEKKVQSHIALDYSDSEDEEDEGEKEGGKERKKVFKHRGKSGIEVGAGMEGEKEDVILTHLCRECLVEF